MPKIRKIQVPSKKPVGSSSPRFIFSLRTKLLIFSGLFMLLLPLLFYLNQNIQLMYFAPQVNPMVHTTTDTQTPNSPPVNITISKVGINLPVFQTIIKNNVWQISGNGVSHLEVSANPGDSGPIIMYAHNTKDRFGPIRWVSTGEMIELTTADNKVHTYKVVEQVTTTPEELTVFFERKSETLYVFTCDGFADLQRHILIAEPIAASTSAELNIQ